MTQETEEYRPFRDLDLSNARGEDETYEDYKERIKVERSLLDDYLRGVLIPSE